ncbi:hypothetical protein PR048_013253 [Dryococelus australis]|uniref:Uncharacterized protein n=1 Tax=Dryococelus australis TaxID=614101 RepID=A0ABQ9HRM0_9NEOP|nr:hypothetical protein PR048_013253 [Dryococelus australis]
MMWELRHDGLCIPELLCTTYACEGQALLLQWACWSPQEPVAKKLRQTDNNGYVVSYYGKINPPYPWGVRRCPHLMQSVSEVQEKIFCVANGSIVWATHSIILHLKLESPSWNEHFTTVNVADSCLSFGLARNTHVILFLHNLGKCCEVIEKVAGKGQEAQLEELEKKFSDVLMMQMGRCDVTLYKFEFMDYTPLRSRYYNCAPPKLETLGPSLIKCWWLGKSCR